MGRRFWNNSNNRPACQICGVTCHIAEKCYYRFDPDFVPFLKQGSSSQGSYKPPSQRPVAAAATANSESPNDDWCYPDSGASHHVTSELGNLSLGSEYHGHGKVHMGNGEGLSIPHIGTSRICSPSSSRIFCLNKLLCVPHIIKYLISASQVALDNRVFFEIHLCFSCEGPSNQGSSSHWEAA